MIDSNFIIELWEIIYPNIPKKDQSDIAYSMIRLLQDYDVNEEALAELLDYDNKKLREAFIDVYEIEVNEETE